MFSDLMVYIVSIECIPHLVNRCKLFLFARTELHRRSIILSKAVASNVSPLLLVHIVPSDVHTLQRDRFFSLKQSLEMFSPCCWYIFYLVIYIHNKLMKLSIFMGSSPFRNGLEKIQGIAQLILLVPQLEFPTAKSAKC